MRVLLILCLVWPALSRSPRIVGGRDADAGEWPWQLALLKGGSFICGASLIRANWGITAAHCIGNAPNLYSVMAGTNDVNCENGDCQKRACTVATRHPLYSANGIDGYPNDIAILRWDLAIDQIPDKIQYIPMASTTGQEGRNCFITGWGRLTGFGASPTWLQEAHIDVLSRTECLNYWNENEISDNHVCVHDKATQLRGACNGDSGGPMVCQMDVSGEWELVGVTSWGRAGCSPNFPSVYTRVSSYHDWILSTIDA